MERLFTVTLSALGASSMGMQAMGEARVVLPCWAHPFVDPEHDRPVGQGELRIDVFHQLEAIASKRTIINTMSTILHAVIPIFLLIGTGNISVRLGYYRKEYLGAIASFVLRLCLPALVFGAIIGSHGTQIIDLRYLLAYAAGSIAMLLLGLLWASRVRGRSLGQAAIYGLGMSCSNSAFIGFPIIHQLFGSMASLSLALTMLVENSMVLPLAMTLASADGASAVGAIGALRKILRALLSNPIVIALALALLLKALGVHTPELVLRAISILAGASAPAALFFIGGSLVGIRVRGMLGDAVSVGAAKLVGHPVLVLAAMLLLRPHDPTLAAAGVILASAPMFSTFPIIGQLQMMEEFCATTVLLTTSAALVSLTTVAWLLRLSGVFAR